MFLGYGTGCWWLAIFVEIKRLRFLLNVAIWDKWLEGMSVVWHCTA